MITRSVLAGLVLASSALLACSSDSSPSDPAPGAGGSSGSGASGQSGTAGAAAGVSGASGQSGAGAAGSAGQSAGGTAGSGGAAGSGAGPGGGSGVAGTAGSAGAGAVGAGAAGAGAAGVAGTGGSAAGAGGGGAGGTSAGAGGVGGAAGTAGASGGSGQGGAVTCDQTLVGSPCATGFPGVCATGTQACTAGKLTCVPDTAPGSQGEMCNGLDDDCNGQVDDLDVGGDGICDCLRIGLLGMPGSLPSSNFQAWLQARGTSVTRIQDTDDTMDQPLDAAALSQFDVLIVDQLRRDYTATEAAALQTWVKDEGGGVVTMTGYTNSPDPDFLPNVLLTPFGLSYGGPLSIGPANMFAVHPVTEGLTSVTFNGGYVVSSTPVDGATSTPIAFNQDGTVAYAHEQGQGRLVAWGDEWIEYDSEWQKLPEIEHFWVNLMNWTGPRDSCQVPKP